MNTKLLSTTEYKRYNAYNPRENILKLVNIEALRACQIEGETFTDYPKIPKVQEPPKLPLSAGVFNMVREFIV